jgi:hypothetical protein
MTGSYCSTCGAQLSPGARFCASCGTALDASASVQSPVGGSTAWEPPPVTPQTGIHPIAPPVHPQPTYPLTGYQPSVPQQPAPGQAEPQHTYSPPSSPQPTYPQTGQQPPVGPSAFPGQGAPQIAAPWGTAPNAASRPTGVQGRSLVDAVMTGDWGGAARTAGLAVAVMLGISLVGVLLISQGQAGFHETVALVFAGVCLAVGGDAFASADSDSFGASLSLGLLPLTVTLAGLGVLGWLFGRRMATRARGRTEALLQAVRTVLGFTAFFLPLSLLTRYTNNDPNVLGITGKLGVGVLSTVFGALLFAVAALGTTWLFHRGTTLPGRVSASRDRSRAPLVAAAAVFAVGLFGVVAALVYGLVNDDEKVSQIGVALLGAGNGALASVLWAAGVPLNVSGGASSTVLGEFTPSGARSVTLFTFTDDNGWFWLAPVVLLAAMLVVAAALAVRQNTVEDARREGFRFAGALAVVAFLATLLLRIAIGGEATEFSSSADGLLMFNPIVAAFVLAVWGVVTGLLAPVVAAKLPGGFVTRVRRRFGAAATAPTPPPAY